MMLPDRLIASGEHRVDIQDTLGHLDQLVARGKAVVRELQYEVREGGEAGEVVCIFKALIANRNSSFILLEVGDGTS